MITDREPHSSITGIRREINLTESSDGFTAADNEDNDTQKNSVYLEQNER